MRGRAGDVVGDRDRNGDGDGEVGDGDGDGDDARGDVAGSIRGFVGLETLGDGAVRRRVQPRRVPTIFPGLLPRRVYALPQVPLLARDAPERRRFEPRRRRYFRLGVGVVRASLSGGKLFPEAGACSVAGGMNGASKENQDEHFAVLGGRRHDFAVGVLDGHGADGRRVSTLVVQKIGAARLRRFRGVV